MFALRRAFSLWFGNETCIGCVFGASSNLVVLVLSSGGYGFCFDSGVGNGGAAAGLKERKLVFFCDGLGFAPHGRMERRKRNVSSFCIVALTKIEVKTQFE